MTKGGLYRKPWTQKGSDKKSSQYIALVGGFGGSRFLKQEIENAFGGESDVLQAPPEKT